MHSFVGRFFRTKALCLVALTLVAQAFSIGALCDPIHVAAAENDLTKVRALLKGNPRLVLSVLWDGSTPLHIAADHGYKDLAALLLSMGANVNARDKEGNTPLHNAVASANRQLVELLLANKAETNEANDEGLTPLYYAVREGLFATREGQVEIAEILLGNGADVDARDKTGMTLLQHAADSGDSKASAYLLAHKADVRAKDGGGYTPLHYAAKHGDLEIVGLLLGNGAEVNAVANDGSTPLHLAISTLQLGRARELSLVFRFQTADLLRRNGGEDPTDPCPLPPAVDWAPSVQLTEAVDFEDGDWSGSLKDLRAGIANSVVASQWPGAHFEADAKSIGTSATYFGSQGSVRLPGSKVTIKVSQGNGPLAGDEWETYFASFSADIRQPKVDVTRLLAMIYRNLGITQENLAKLARAGVPEVRMAAFSDITDAALRERTAAGQACDVLNDRYSAVWPANSPKAKDPEARPPEVLQKGRVFNQVVIEPGVH